MRLSQLLDPHPTPSPPVLTPAQVGGLAAWQDLLRRGAVKVLYQAPWGDETIIGVPSTQRITPTHRALVVAMLLSSPPLTTPPARAVLAGASAAWVYTSFYHGVHTPYLHPGVTLEVAHNAGVHRPDVPHGTVIRRSRALERDTTQLAGVPITSPLRTARDIACHLRHDHAVATLVALAAGSADIASVDLDQVAASLETRQRVVGRPAARKALTEAQNRLQS